MPRNFLLILGVVACGPAIAHSAEKDAAPADREGIEYFETHIRPLLVKRCYECHSAEAKELKGGLALDTRSGWAAGGDSGPAIVPGKPDESHLIAAVRYQSFEMPPKGRLPEAEIALLVKWVERGAPDPRDGTTPAKAEAATAIDFDKARQFWAFQLPEARRAPAVQNADWPADDLDRHILARLEDRGLQPSPDADRATWLRRVTQDLTGLPPRPVDLEDFLADSRADATARVVDRLLASPEFGVHWGRHWLDVARYADSNGSDFNATFFNAWRYRNYVIDAFNDDKPYVDFVREQIAGDLLPAATDEQRERQLVATSFLMVGAKMLSERDKSKLTMDVVDEQIDTVGKAFLGMTLGCARCHDHKFDPIPTEDYYALAGIFRSTVTLEGESQQYVSTWVETPLAIPPELAEKLSQHKVVRDELAGKVAASKKALKAAQDELARLNMASTGVVVDDAAATFVGQWKASKSSSQYVGAGYRHDEKSGKGEKSVCWTPDIPEAGEYEVQIAFAAGNGRDTAVPVVVRHADGESDFKIDQTRTPAIDKLFHPLGKFRFEKGKAGSVTLSNAGTTEYVIADAVRFVAVAGNSGQAPEATASEVAERERLNKLVAEHGADVKKLEAEMKTLDQRGPKPPTAMAAREAREIGDCAICIRGEVSRPGKKVDRGFLRVMSDRGSLIERKTESGRRELADWIARPDHPLTARVMVNRIWQNMLGEGLVRSVDNFGHLGETPSHPELLETLAVQFVESGWSVKSLVRRIALSRTYGQSSQFNPRAFEIDADNRLLWRAHRKRVPAESLRDAILLVSGQLDSRPAGSPVEGLGLLAIDNSKQDASGRKADSALRSVYLPIIRNELPSFLTVFDFADPDVVTGRRPVTNVPAQSLFLLNSPFVKQQARTTAVRLLAETEDDSAVVDRAYPAILARAPSDKERERILAYLAEVIDGQSSRRTDAWTQVIQSLFASTEFRLLD
ncbi:MAG: DUF1553 domain-containing protein [Planctomycetaceae bacterium]|nr:DUF1553 domain-containing protein [Planctomycetaceae bacterium]